MMGDKQSGLMGYTVNSVSRMALNAHESFVQTASSHAHTAAESVTL